MKNPFKVLTVFGSPADKASNTRAFADGFLDMVEEEGLTVEREYISLGKHDIQMCRGCWACTRGAACPIDDDINSIKAAMVDCDMLILASPVYTNQVSAQMKAFLDRLFTWCHVFPLIGKYGLSLVTTANDGHEETANFLEKMLATYGIQSFGPVTATGAFSSGLFPRKASELARYRKLAQRVAWTVRGGKFPRATAWNKKMFKAMRRKMAGMHAIRYILDGPIEGQPDPPRFLVNLIKKRLEQTGSKRNVLQQMTRNATFEYEWWKARGWFGTKSFRELAATPLPERFDVKERLLEHAHSA